MYRKDDIFSSMGANQEIDQINQDIRMMQDRRQQVLDEAQVPKLPPVEQTLVALAYEAGEMSANYRAERKRRERAIAKIDELQSLADMAPVWERRADGWQKRAEAAELKLKRRSVRKR